MRNLRGRLPFRSFGQTVQGGGGMKGKGFAGRILHVDLDSKKIQTANLDEKLAFDYVGGLGICVKLVSDLLPASVKPLASESVFALGAGPLVGTDLPSSSRMYAVAKLPAGGTVGWCGAGGFMFGAQLKYAGYDHIVVSGRADKPAAIYIHDDDVEIRDANRLWGRDVESACEAVYEESGEQAGVLTIGPAGENQAAMALAFVDRVSTLGRGGFGAVMGSKNLKAIVVRGSGGVTAADRTGFNRLSRKILESIRSYPYLKEWQELGMLKAFQMAPAGVYERLKERRLACVSCPVGCKDLVRIPDGPHAGLVKYTSSAINLFTPMMYGMKDPWNSVKLVTDLDSLGLDMFEFFGLLKWADGLVKKGLIILSDGEPAIDLTSLDSMMKWAELVAHRRGAGDILAGGFAGLLKRLGPDAKDGAPVIIKGMHPYAGPGAALPWDRFGTMELGQALDPRGPHVGSGGSPTYFALRPLEVFPKHLKRMGAPDEALDRILGPERNELHVGRLLRWSHAWFATLGSLGICARGQVNRFYDADFCAQIYEAATGIPTTTEELGRRVSRVWTTLRELNIREGLNESDEALPDQWFKEPGFKDYLTGEPLTRRRAESMINEYFDEWGWNEPSRQSGRPG